MEYGLCGPQTMDYVDYMDYGTKQHTTINQINDFSVPHLLAETEVRLSQIVHSYNRLLVCKHSINPFRFICIFPIIIYYIALPVVFCNVATSSTPGPIYCLPAFLSSIISSLQKAKGRTKNKNCVLFFSKQDKYASDSFPSFLSSLDVYFTQSFLSFHFPGNRIHF